MISLFTSSSALQMIRFESDSLIFLDGWPGFSYSLTMVSFIVRFVLNNFAKFVLFCLFLIGLLFLLYFQNFASSKQIPVANLCEVTALFVLVP